jgi:acetyl-CoA carboxylase biotin carboxylase subunit
MPAIYDSLLAKIATWAPTRDQAIARMERALGEFSATGPGIRTTASFLRRVLADEQFRRGAYDTGMVTRLLGDAGVRAREDAGPARQASGNDAQEET